MSELIEVSGCGNDDRLGDVVFVHGLGGEHHDYWCHEGKDETSGPDGWARNFPASASGPTAMTPPGPAGLARPWPCRSVARNSWSI